MSWINKIFNKEEDRNLEVGKTYTIGEVKIYFTEEMAFIAENGVMMQFPFPSFFERMQREEEIKQREQEINKIPHKTNIPSFDNLHTFDSDYLEYLLDKHEKSEDYEMCRAITKELESRV